MVFRPIQMQMEISATCELITWRATPIAGTAPMGRVRKPRRAAYIAKPKQAVNWAELREKAASDLKTSLAYLAQR